MAPLIEPMGSRVLVERLEEPPRMIYVTDREKYRKFRVLAVGPKVSEVKAGDIVVLPGIAADEPDYDTGDAMLVMEGDIGCKVG